MKPAVWQYEDSEKQTVYFRGYVKEYQGPTVILHSCSKVWGNKWKAKEDSEKLFKKLKKSACLQPKTSAETLSS